LNKIRRRLLDLSRQEAERHFNPQTLICLIPRETAWYCIVLLESGRSEDVALANHILARLTVSDGTHSPCTLLVIYHRYRHLLDKETDKNLLHNLETNLTIAAGVHYTDGNVNHPVAAFVHLLCGGELLQEKTFQELGKRQLQEFRHLISNRQHQRHRQAEMAEYNSPTYSALTLWFLALAAEFSQDAEARETALQLEQGLWRNIAMHWHEPSQQICGPFSRAYGEDSYGGFSAVHCTMALALERAIFIEPELVRRFDHPSALIQNALPAILQFHVPEQAMELFFKKPLPFYFRMTTYCEQYHENSSRTKDGKTVSVFDDEVYPGGWGDLTSYLTAEYCLATAGRPYVNAGHSDSFTLRYRKAETVTGLQDFRSLYTRMVFNKAAVAQENICHVTGAGIGRDFLYEEGRAFTCQHENKAMVCYAPKRAGHQNITELRLDLIFSYHAPFDEFYINGHAVAQTPCDMTLVEQIVIRDFQTFLAIYPLAVSSIQNFEKRIRIWKKEQHLMISIFNYQGPAVTLAREQMSLLQNGFVCIVSDTNSFTDTGQFLRYLTGVTITESGHPGGVREVQLQEKTGDLVFRVNTVDERILFRAWNGADLDVRHLEIHGALAENVATIY
jgi:hypothetical protein